MYCSVDMAKIRAAVADGIREIPGVRVDEEPDLTVTSR